MAVLSAVMIMTVVAVASRLAGRTLSAWLACDMLGMVARGGGLDLLVHDGEHAVLLRLDLTVLEIIPVGRLGISLLDITDEQTLHKFGNKSHVFITKMAS